MEQKDKQSAWFDGMQKMNVYQCRSHDCGRDSSEARSGI